MMITILSVVFCVLVTSVGIASVQLAFGVKTENTLLEVGARKISLLVKGLWDFLKKYWERFMWLVTGLAMFAFALLVLVAALYTGDTKKNEFAATNLLPKEDWMKIWDCVMNNDAQTMILVKDSFGNQFWVRTLRGSDFSSMVIPYLYGQPEGQDDKWIGVSLRDEGLIKRNKNRHDKDGAYYSETRVLGLGLNDSKFLEELRVRVQHIERPYIEVVTPNGKTIKVSKASHRDEFGICTHNNQDGKDVWVTVRLNGRGEFTIPTEVVKTWN